MRTNEFIKEATIAETGMSAPQMEAYITGILQEILATVEGKGNIAGDADEALLHIGAEAEMALNWIQKQHKAPSTRTPASYLPTQEPGQNFDKFS